jgi:hypothetical protein
LFKYPARPIGAVAAWWVLAAGVRGVAGGSLGFAAVGAGDDSFTGAGCALGWAGLARGTGGFVTGTAAVALTAGGGGAGAGGGGVGTGGAGGAAGAAGAGGATICIAIGIGLVSSGNGCMCELLCAQKKPAQCTLRTSSEAGITKRIS